MSAKEIDRHLRDLDEPKRTTLEQLRHTIPVVVPEAEQGPMKGIAYLVLADRQSISNICR